jgi:hypothetical protein
MNWIRKTCRDETWVSCVRQSCHVQAHSEWCEDHDTGYLFCDGLDTAERRKHRRRLERSACSPGWPGLENVWWPAMASKSTFQGLDDRYVLYALDL